jgi:hypothetical protein
MYFVEISRLRNIAPHAAKSFQPQPEALGQDKHLLENFYKDLPNIEN